LGPPPVGISSSRSLDDDTTPIALPSSRRIGEPDMPPSIRPLSSDMYSPPPWWISLHVNQTPASDGTPSARLFSELSLCVRDPQPRGRRNKILEILGIVRQSLVVRRSKHCEVGHGIDKLAFSRDCRPAPQRSEQFEIRQLFLVWNAGSGETRETVRGCDDEEIVLQRLSQIPAHRRD
jgi:hypothetical protein